MYKYTSELRADELGIDKVGGAKRGRLGWDRRARRR
jgi:hypothetical protein